MRWTEESAATIRATAARDRNGVIEDLPGWHWRPFKVGRQLVKSSGASGHDGVVPVGPLLAVLMSLQQGRMGVRSPVTSRCRGVCPLPGRFFEAFAAAKYRSPGLPPIPAGLRRSGSDCGGSCQFLNTARCRARAGLGLTQSFKRQAFQALSLRSVLAGLTHPPI